VTFESNFFQQGDLKMKRKLCIGLGIAMIAFVGLVASGVVGTNDSVVRSVSAEEARLVMGGGQYGKTNKTKDGYTCRDGYTGCTGTGYSLSILRPRFWSYTLSIHHQGERMSNPKSKSVFYSCGNQVPSRQVNDGTPFNA
jgi:hypothetical protein